MSALPALSPLPLSLYYSKVIMSTDNLPGKLLGLKGQPAVMSTEFLGAIDEGKEGAHAS